MSLKQASNSSSKKKLHTEHLVKSQLRTIFLFYVSFGDRTNISFLKSNKFVKLVNDSQIKLSATELDILYYQATKNTETLTLLQFQQLLLKLAQRLYTEVPLAQAFHQLFENHFVDLYEKIATRTDFGEGLRQIQEFRSQISSQYDNLLLALKPLLQKIHAYIFKEQSQKLSKVQQQYIGFLTQFDIIPNVINQALAQILFMDLIYRDSPDDQPSRYLLSFSKFIESLIIISMYQNCSTTPIEQFKALLDKIENSRGFEAFAKFQFHTKNESTQLVMPLERLYSSRVQSAKQSCMSKSDGTYSKELRNLFEYFAQLGEPTNLELLKSIKFQKLLQLSGVMQYLSVVDADMIYIQATPKKKYDAQKTPQFKTPKLYEVDRDPGKMNFQQFQVALEMLASRCFQGEYQSMIEQFFLPLEIKLKLEKQQQIQQILMELLNSPEILKLQELMYNHFEPYYNYYTKDVMHSADFMRFCLDFELSSSIVSQGSLLHTFKAIASINKGDYLDKTQFVYAICVVGILVYANVPSYYQRIVYLLERVTQTEGAVKISKQLGITKNPQNWTLIEAFRCSHVSENKKQAYDFDDIIDQIY